MDVTRQEQAEAILQRRARKLASQILGRRAASAADFTEAFNVERIDLLAEIGDEQALLALGRNVAGPADGFYVMPDEHGYRMYVQERGIPHYEARGLDFERARDAAVDRLLMMNGIPFSL